MSNIKDWLAQVDSTPNPNGTLEPIKTGDAIKGYGDSSIGVTNYTSPVNLNEYTGYTGSRVLSGTGDDFVLLDEIRAQNQSAFAQARNAIGKFGIYAGTTFVDGVAGTITGLANMVTGGDDGVSQWSDFWNNPLSNAMTDIQEWSERAMPNYRTAAELDAPFWKSALGMSDGFVNFWGDTVFKNLGFTVGALGAAALSGGVAGEGILLKNISQSIAKRSFGKMAKALSTSEDDVIRMIASGDKSIQTLTGQLAKDARTLKNLNALQQGQGALMSAMAEARFEAIHGAKQYYDENKAKYMQLGMSEEEADMKASKESLGVGNTIFALNTALLSVSNAAQFKSILSPGYEVESKAIKGLVKQGNKYAYEGMSRLDKVATALKNPFLEGVEEMTQTGIQYGSQSYFERLNDPETTNQLNNIIASASDGMRKAFSEEGLEGFFTGFFTGAVGMPNIRKAIQDKSFKSALSGWSGGIAEQVRSLNADAALGKANAEKLNKIIESEDFQKGYMNVASMLGASKEKQEALTQGDEVGYEVANNKMFHATAQQFIDSGKLDDLHDTLKEQERKDADTLRTEWQIKGEDGKTKDPFNHLTDKQLVEYNKERVKQQTELLDKIAEFTGQVEIKTGGISEPLKKTLVEALTTTYFAEKKGEELRNSIVSKLSKWKASKNIDSPTQLDFRNQETADLLANTKDKIENPKNSMESIHNDLIDYQKDTKDFDAYNDFKKWSRYQKTRQEALELYSQITSNPIKFEQKLNNENHVKAEVVAKKIAANDDEKVVFDTEQQIDERIKALGYGENEDVLVKATDSKGIEHAGVVKTIEGVKVFITDKGKTIQLKDLVGKPVQILSKDEKVRLALPDEVDPTIVQDSFGESKKTRNVEPDIQKEEINDNEILAQEESPEEWRVDYKKDDVGSLTYQHVLYGRNFQDETETFVFNGQTYTRPKFSDNEYVRNFGDWMSSLVDPSNYSLLLVTQNTATEEQQDAINRFNPSNEGVDSIYVFVVDSNRNLVRHEGKLLVSSILDSTKNDTGGKRFGLEQLRDFMKINGAKISFTKYDEGAAPDVYRFTINGVKQEFKLSDFVDRESAVATFEGEFYDALTKEYANLKKSLYEAVNTSPEYRTINRVSNGFPVRVKEKGVMFDPKAVFKPEDLKSAKLRISTGKTKDGVKDGMFPSSLPIMTIGGRDVGMKVRNLNAKEVDFVYSLLKHHGIGSRDSTAKVGNVPVFPQQIVRGKNRPAFSVLTNYLNVGAVKKKGETKIDRESDQIFITENDRLVIISKNDLKTGEKLETFQTLDIPLSEIEQYEKEIKTYLKTKRRNINKDYLADPNSKAIEYSIDDKGKFTAKTLKKSYNDYLISEVVKTDTVPYTEGAQFAQRYFAFNFQEEQKNDVKDLTDWDKLETETVPFEEEKSVSVANIQETKISKPTASARDKKLFDTTKKELVRGAVVLYNGKQYLFWNINEAGKAQLIKTDGSKFSGTPGTDKLTVQGTYPTIEFNGTEYIVTDNDNVYSGATGKLVYTGADGSSKAQKQRILDKAKSTQSVSNDSGLEATSEDPTATDFATQTLELPNPPSNEDFGFDEDLTDDFLNQFEDASQVKPDFGSSFRYVSPGKTLEELIKNDVIEKECL